MTVYTRTEKCDCYTAFEEGQRSSTETFHVGNRCSNPEHLLCAEEGGIPQDCEFAPDDWIEDAIAKKLA